MKLGQSSTTLSGGEAKRMKLAKELTKTKYEPTLYILDKPTTGLHFKDISLLLKILKKLIEKGHTIIIEEHHLDVIAHCDYIVDLGPEGGSQGGKLLFEGPTSKILSCAESYTAIYLKPYFQK